MVGLFPTFRRNRRITIKAVKKPVNLSFEQRLSKNWGIIEGRILTKFSHPEDVGCMFLRGVAMKDANGD
jgi:hypothetical protein